MTQEMSTADYHALVSEKVFTDQVMTEAKANGWMAYHTHDSRRSAPGFPDIVAVNPDREQTIFAELKTVQAIRTKGHRLSNDQRRWLDALEEAGADVYLWSPDDWDEIRAVLRGDQR